MIKKIGAVTSGKFAKVLSKAQGNSPEGSACAGKAEKQMGQLAMTGVFAKGLFLGLLILIQGPLAAKGAELAQSNSLRALECGKRPRVDALGNER